MRVLRCWGIFPTVLVTILGLIFFSWMRRLSGGGHTAGRWRRRGGGGGGGGGDGGGGRRQHRRLCSAAAATGAIRTGTTAADGAGRGLRGRGRRGRQARPAEAAAVLDPLCTGERRRRVLPGRRRTHSPRYPCSCALLWQRRACRTPAHVYTQGLLWPTVALHVGRVPSKPILNGTPIGSEP